MQKDAQIVGDAIIYLLVTRSKKGKLSAKQRAYGMAKSLLDIRGGAYDTVDAFIRDDIAIIYLLFTRSKKGKLSAKQCAYSMAKACWISEAVHMIQ